MMAIRGLVRAYGPIMTGYIVGCSAIWLLVLIALPQLVMIDYSIWHEDVGARAKIEKELEQTYVELQLVSLRLARSEEPDVAEDPFAGGGAETDRAELERRRDALQQKAAALEQEVETALDKLGRTYGPENYLRFLGQDRHIAIFLKTIWASVVVTLLSLLVCYPIVFYVAKVAPRRRVAVIMLGLIVPYWVNEILRTFAWLMILSPNGLMNAVLTTFGLVEEPVAFLSGNTGVLVGMIYAYILFMVFPMYNIMETLDRNQLEAARDLGAPWWGIHKDIVVPHAKPGIAVGCIMTFMLAAGSYAVPQILGGTSGDVWFTQVIYTQFMTTRNWNLGAAYALLLLAVCIAFMLVAMRLFGVRLRDIAK